MPPPQYLLCHHKHFKSPAPCIPYPLDHEYDDISILLWLYHNLNQPTSALKPSSSWATTPVSINPTPLLPSPYPIHHHIHNKMAITSFAPLCHYHWCNFSVLMPSLWSLWYLHWIHCPSDYTFDIISMIPPQKLTCHFHCNFHINNNSESIP